MEKELKKENQVPAVQEDTAGCCHCHKTKERTEKEYKDLIHRLPEVTRWICASGRFRPKAAWPVLRRSLPIVRSPSDLSSEKNFSL